MIHADHVNLIRNGVPSSGGVWADFGSGTGAFTLALVELLGPTGEIYSIDQNAAALKTQAQLLCERFPGNIVHYRRADFTRPIELPPLNGGLMANSLHFHRNKRPLIESIKSYLKPLGRLILVEYNVDVGNSAVPYPLPYPAWVKLSADCGLANTQLLATRPSRFLNEIYSAVSW